MVYENIKTEQISNSMSDHDYFDPANGDGTANAENQMEMPEENVDVGMPDDRADFDNANLYPKRAVKKPIHYSVTHQQVMTKKKNLGTNSTKRPTRNTAKKNNSGTGKKLKLKLKRHESEPLFEVDYIFGKRPDKDKEGKVEYRVMWKGYSKHESTWEPEDSLHGASDSIKAYELQLKGEYNNTSGEEDEVEAKPEPKVTIRKKEKSQSRNISRAKSLLPSKPNKKVEEVKPKMATMQARTRSISPARQNKNIGARVKRERGISKFSSKEISPGEESQLSRGSGSNNKRAKMDDMNLQPTTSSRGRVLPSEIENRSQSVNKLRANDIAMVDNVRKSAIDGVDYIADVILKDGTSRTSTLANLKKICLELVAACYERQLGIRIQNFQ